MKFNSTDAWLLASIFRSEGEEGAALRSVIAYADYACHAIMTYSEFSGSLQKLTSVGLVTSSNALLRTSSEFKQWHKKKYKGKTRYVVLKEIDDFEKYLNTTFSEASFNNVQIEFTPEQFQNAVDEYLKQANDR